jgi:hypothetical protein
MEKDAVSAILGPAENKDGEEGPDPLEVASQELLEAVHARNPQDVAQALRACFECLDTDDDGK